MVDHEWVFTLKSLWGFPEADFSAGVKNQLRVETNQGFPYMVLRKSSILVNI